MSSGRDRRCSPSGTAATRVQSPERCATRVERVLPRHVGVLQPVQDMHGAAGIERLVADEVAPAVLDQLGRDGIGSIPVARGPQVDAPLLDLATGGGWQVVPHQLGHVPGRCDQHQPLDALGRLGGLGQEVAQQQERDVAAHAGADQHLRPVGQPIERGARLLEPAAHRAVLEPALGLAVARVVEAQAADALAPPPIGLRRQP